MRRPRLRGRRARAGRPEVGDPQADGEQATAGGEGLAERTSQRRVIRDTGRETNGEEVLGAADQEDASGL
jgi:hypothetical protein